MPGGNTIREALDGAVRRRVYLFRHGAVDYVDANGNWVDDPDAVDLNPRGLSQARQVAAAFAGVHVDLAVCSGLPRTRQTAEIVLAERGLPVRAMAGFEEIRPIKGQTDPQFDLLQDIAFSHWRAHEPGARFLGGERYSDFYARVVETAEALLDDGSWSSAAVFAHGATNAALLGWVTGLGMAAFGAFDQETCCLNVIDFDVHEHAGVVRKTIRAMNVTAEDPVKQQRHAGDLELLARRLKRLESAA